MAIQPTKQVRGLDEHVACDVCGRTMLKGERPEPYLAPSRERKMVCQLCAQRAQKEGWIRESSSDAPVQPPRPSERGRLFRRRRRSPLDDDGAQPPLPEEGEERPETPFARAVPQRMKGVPRDPRHVRAVPTSTDLKIERALDLFNGSEHARTVAGIARTLGPPRVSACTSSVSAAKVLLTVAWELSWYQFAIDLSDTGEPVQLERRGHELDELPAKVRHWNASADSEGRIAVGAAEQEGEPELERKGEQQREQQKEPRKEPQKETQKEPQKGPDSDGEGSDDDL